MVQIPCVDGGNFARGALAVPSSSRRGSYDSVAGDLTPLMIGIGDLALPVVPVAPVAVGRVDLAPGAPSPPSTTLSPLFPLIPLVPVPRGPLGVVLEVFAIEAEAYAMKRSASASALAPQLAR